MNEIIVAVVGNVATAPQHLTSKQGTPMIKFRLANTPRRWVNGDWQDGPSSFMSVTGWRGLADNAASSIRKGDPVIVVGRLRVNDWRKEDGRTGRDVEIEAAAVGHDLSRGTSAFLKRPSTNRGNWRQPDSASTRQGDDLRADDPADEEFSEGYDGPPDEEFSATGQHRVEAEQACDPESVESGEADHASFAA